MADPEHVDRIRDARLGRKQLREPRCRLVGEPRQFQPRGLARVGRQDPEAAGVRQDGDAPAERERLRGEEHRDVDELLEALRRITPAWWKSASTAASELVSAAVCDPAAFAPADVRPLLSARIGFERETRRAMRANLRGLPNDSR